MALISAGTSVTISNESFFIPSQQGTVALVVIATADEKFQPDDITPAAGTLESGVVRTVTSVTQSVQLYGIPRFLQDISGNQHHGDARNEYGLFALNQFLGVSNRAYALRANINLNDDFDDLLESWTQRTSTAGEILEANVQAFLDEFNLSNGYITGDEEYRVTVTSAEILTLANQALQEVVYNKYNFSGMSETFEDDHTLEPLLVYANGYNVATTGDFLGLAGLAAAWVAGDLGSVEDHEWTAAEANSFLTDAADDFQFTVEFRTLSSLGANDAARRVAIVSALQSVINTNQEIRNENYEYNLVVCPGYFELADELVSLTVDLADEVMAIGDTPMNMDPDAVVTWAGTVAKQSSENIAYYYPHGLASNLNGANVLVSSSGIALRTMGYSDRASALWFAPAGTRRGLVTGVSQIGYASGTLGSPTVFNEAPLNQGQRDNLYKYFTNINPITFFPGRGIIVWGQKTTPADASAMDRINVSRLIKFIKRQLRKNTLGFIFEPNDQLTRDNLKATIDGFLGNLLTRRALYDFVTVCNEYNNPGSVVDEGIMVADVALKPTRAMEFLLIPIRILSTNASV